MMRMSWCGQVAAPKAMTRLAFSRRLGASPSAAPMANTTAGLPRRRHSCSRAAKAALLMVSAFIQDHGDRAIGDHIGNCNRFFEHAPGSVAGAALFDFDDIDGAQSEFAAGIQGALAIAFGELALGTLLQTTDGSDHDAHA